MRIGFFAVNRTQQRYFKRLHEHIACSTYLLRSKRFMVPDVIQWRVCRQLIHLETLVEHKLREKCNAGSLFGRGMGAWVMKGYLKVMIPLMAMRYIGAIRDPRYDTIAVWNGKHLRQAVVIQLARGLGKKTLFFENGMLPNTTVCDPYGVNADNSVSRESAFFAQYSHDGSPELPTKLIPRSSKKGNVQHDQGAWLPETYVFVPFQVNHDTQITHHSPWLKDMEALFALFERMAQRFPQQHFILKEHPSDARDYSGLYTRAAKMDNLTFANGVATQRLIQGSRCVATINSSVGIEAMLYGKPVIVLGEAFYAIEGITYPVTSETALQRFLEQGVGTPDGTLTRHFLEYLYHDYLIPGHWKQPGEAHFEAINQKLGCQHIQKECALFMVSTSLHLYNAIVAAMMHPQWESHLFFIDQPDEEHHLYYKALQGWEARPFTSISMYRTRVKGMINKFRVRRNAFERMGQEVGRIAPRRVYVGNDRRIEFAYALHIAKGIHPDVIGGYLDDGAYSYIIQKSRWYQDTWIDLGLKKLLYGSWYFRPSIIASSDAVQEAFVALPEFVHQYLASKRLICLETQRLLEEQVQPFTDYLVAPYHLDREDIAALDLVFILPHESLIARYPEFKNTLLRSIQNASEEGLHVGVKYHPRQSHPDPLGVASLRHVMTLPNTLPFEALLPLLGHTVIVGDVSSALLMARWLRPDLSVISLYNAEDTRQEDMGEIFQHVGVSIVTVEHLQNTLKKECLK